MAPETHKHVGAARLSKRNKSEGGVRTQAVRVLEEVIKHHHSLATVLPRYQMKVDARDRALLQELCYGTLRWYEYLDAIAAELLHKPLKSRDQDIHCLVLMGLYQLIYMRIPAHAAVDETVSVTDRLNKRWARGVVNAVLRGWQRDHADIESRLIHSEQVMTSHPAWLLTELQAAWPDDWRQIVQANNQRPPMSLRVNRQRISRDDYLRELLDQNIEAKATGYSPVGVSLKTPVDVTALPGFDDGQVSVQDEAAQLAAVLVNATPGERILDACAAPGGKTTHILESQPDLQVVAVDIDSERLRHVEENLQRCQLQAQLVTGDAARPEDWWDGVPFDRILLDAPCSASGVIRRHPDIKHLRRKADIQPLVATQAKLLDALWPLLRPGGMLVYATCSVLPQENSEQLSRFIAARKDAREQVIDAGWGRTCQVGRQILPGDGGPDENGMDGFYYACLVKG